MGTSCITRLVVDQSASSTLYNEYTICCTVTFYSKKRKTPPNLNNGKYCPHFVIKGFDQLLGVNFIEGEEVIFKNK